MSARNLRGQDKSAQLTIALIWPIDTRVSLVGRILTGIQNYIASLKSGPTIKLLVETFQNEEGISSVKGLQTSSYFNGAIIANTTAADEAYIHRSKPGVPIVLFNRVSSIYSVIQSKNYEAGQAVADHFIRNHHQHISILVPDVSSQALEAGVKGVTDRIEQTDVTYCHHYCSYTEQGGYDSIKQLIKQGQVPTAVICLSDHVALGALSALNDYGISVPADCEVMGFDNQEFSKFTNPKLSTVNLPVEKMAYCAGELLVKTISDPYGDVDQQIFDLEIIHRNTTRIK